MQSSRQLPEAISRNGLYRVLQNTWASTRIERFYRYKHEVALIAGTTIMPLRIAVVDDTQFFVFMVNTCEMNIILNLRASTDPMKFFRSASFYSWFTPL